MANTFYDLLPALKNHIKTSILAGITDANGIEVSVYDYIPVWDHMAPTEPAAIGFKLLPASFSRNHDHVTTMVQPINFSIAVRNGSETDIFRLADAIVKNFELDDRQYFWDWYLSSFATEDLFQDEFSNEKHMSIGSLTITVELPIIRLDYHS